MSGPQLGPKGSSTVQAGVFRRRIDIQKEVRSQDSAGGITKTWVTVPQFKNIPCNIDPTGGSEFFAANQIQAIGTAMISFRWRPGVEATMRVVHKRNPPDVPGQDIYNIEGISTDDTGRKILTLYCKIRSADGIRADG